MAPYKLCNLHRKSKISQKIFSNGIVFNLTKKNILQINIENYSYQFPMEHHSVPSKEDPSPFQSDDLFHRKLLFLIWFNGDYQYHGGMPQL